MFIVQRLKCEEGEGWVRVLNSTVAQCDRMCTDAPQFFRHNLTTIRAQLCHNLAAIDPMGG